MDLVKRVVPQLIANGAVVLPNLNITVADPNVGKQLGVKSSGVLVQAVPTDLYDAEPVEDSGDSEDEPEPPPEPYDPHRVKLTKEEYDEILDWSDDEDTVCTRLSAPLGATAYTRSS